MFIFIMSSQLAENLEAKFPENFCPKDTTKRSKLCEDTLLYKKTAEAILPRRFSLFK